MPTPTEHEALAAILHERFPYIDQREINRPVTVHWFDVIRAIETALSTPAARMLAGEGEAVADAWQDLVDKDDRTSPEEYPDMALITREELVDYMQAAHPPAAEPVGVREALIKCRSIAGSVRRTDKVANDLAEIDAVIAALATPARTDAGEQPLMLCKHCGRDKVSAKASGHNTCLAPFDRQEHSFTREHPYLKRS